MNEAFSALVNGTTDLGTAASENLGASWRSTGAPLELSNTLFGQVFSDRSIDEVTLSIPPQREHLRSIGIRELSVPNSDRGKDAQSNSRMVRTIADGVTDPLRRSPQLRDGPVNQGDIAVHMRTNSQVASVIAELVTLMPDHSRHDTWFEDTARITDKEERHKHPQEWWLDPTLTALSDLTVNAAHHSSVELLLAIIDALDLPQRIKSWTTPESRLATLDALCQIAGEYEDAAHQTRMPVMSAGLLDHPKEAATVYEQTCTTLCW